MRTATARHGGGVTAACAIDVLPGLVGTLDESAGGWRLTHERSGLAVSRAVWETPAELVKAAVTLCSAIDYTRSAAALRGDPLVHSTARELERMAPRRSDGPIASDEELADLRQPPPTTPASLLEVAQLQEPPIRGHLEAAAAALREAEDLAEEYLVELFELRRRIAAAAPRLAAELIGRNNPPC